MAVHFETATPKKLLRQFKTSIDEGHIVTWSYDNDGDFTHTPSQWFREAWLRPKITEGAELIFYILAPKETKLSSEIYAVYHGRFIESMLNHCDAIFSRAWASAMPEDGDFVG